MRAYAVAIAFLLTGCTTRVLISGPYGAYVTAADVR